MLRVAMRSIVNNIFLLHNQDSKNFIMQCIYDASDLIEAHIVKGMLEQQNIDFYIGGYYLQGGIGELPASGNVSLWVADEKIVQAIEIIKAYDSNSFINS